MQGERPTFAGGNQYRFRLINGQLERVDADEPAPIEGGAPSDVAVIVDLFTSGNSLVCGRIEMSTASTTENHEEYLLGPHATAEHISSAIWRQLPIGQLIEETTQDVRQTAGKIFELTSNDRLDQIARSERPRGTPGPRSSLTPELLFDVVIPAYSAGGRKRVVAVQQALQAHGYPGPYGSAEVTIDQARKAVARARKIFPDRMPPARGQRGTRSENQS